MADPGADLVDRLRALPGISERVQRGGAVVNYAMGEVIVARLHLGEDVGMRVDLRCRRDLFDLLCAIDGIIPAAGLPRGEWIAIVDPAALAKINLAHLLDEARRLAKRRR